MKNKNINIKLATILIVAGISRLAFIIFFHADAGDTPTYELFAENILRGCGLSFSDPSSNSCTLTSGGYFPGYPAYIAINWYLFGKSYYAILVSQLCSYLLALYWLLNAILRITDNNKAVIYIGALLALSPLQIGWFRYTITEPLALAFSIWILAEIIISISKKKIRKYHLAAALCASVYIRPDTLLMFVGVMVVAFFIYDKKNAIMQISIVFLLTCIPISGWMVRNMVIGHAPINMTSDASPKAPGYLKWLDTWIVNEYERSDANFPVWNRSYSKINIHNSQYISKEEMTEIMLLLNNPLMIDFDEFPKVIDKRFSEIAIEKLSSRPFYISIEIYTKRIFWILLNPFSSWGLPFEINSINKNVVLEAIYNNDLTNISNQTSQYIVALSGKILSLFYRLILFITFGAIVIKVIRRLIINKDSESERIINIIITVCAFTAITRILFFVYLGALESRYLVEIVPSIECCCILFYCKKINRNK